MTDEALALAFRTGMPYVGLRDHAHDPELDDLIPPDLARSARALPLAADDDRIRLAVADPEPDLSALDPYLSGRQIHLALAPRDELDKILGPPPVRVAEPALGEAVAAPDAGRVGDEEEPAGEATGAGEVAEPAAGAAVAAPDAGPVGDEEEPARDAAMASEAAEPVAAEETLADDLAPAHEGQGAEPLAAGAEASTTEAPLAEDLAGARDAEGAEVAEAPLAEDLAAAREPEVPEPLADDGEALADGPVEHRAAEEPAAAAAAAGETPPDDHPELAGEVPSWLQPRRRRWPVVLALIIVFLVLVAAAAAVYAYVVT